MVNNDEYRGFEHRFGLMVETAKKICTQQGDHYPQIVAFTRQGEMLEYRTVFTAPEHHAVFADAVRKDFRKKHVAEYFFICSVYMQLVVADSAHEAIFKGRQHKAERFEGLIVVGVHYDRKKVEVWDVLRGPDEQIVGYGEEIGGKFGGESVFEGRFTELISPKVIKAWQAQRN